MTLLASGKRGGPAPVLLPTPPRRLRQGRGGIAAAPGGLEVASQARRPPRTDVSVLDIHRAGARRRAQARRPLRNLAAAATEPAESGRRGAGAARAGRDSARRRTQALAHRPAGPREGPKVRRPHRPLRVFRGPVGRRGRGRRRTNCLRLPAHKEVPHPAPPS